MASKGDCLLLLSPVLCRDTGPKSQSRGQASNSHGAMKILKTWFDTKEGLFALLVLHRIESESIMTLE